ncbi:MULTISPECIES: Crp/Fnr family transcriptional regulator [Alphaproteobacteria]|uniref:Nitrogen fixation regulation protein FixK n=2 Tax=Alphaproteobacteria TaxID=28211 RepID=A0A512HK93_9HYPH|nr:MULTISPECIES: Crp/Fnr family transcriptional regulator [Alphaproteobacteria]GEO85864.1 nitrogen fixation regulation protein FixK [Ciceribacter naphthalenivorans]GLR21720.1 nitrogen fixation regulation protein FixK [Ciceribacter naphthalenivorans]GLT04576.1 nitrogen fixation regulation protein FixK [Sphingomonas psychrolutea]
MLQFSLKAANVRALPSQLLVEPAPTHHSPTVLRLSPRSTLFLEGYARAPQYRVVEGCVALSQSLSDGRRQIIDMIGPGRMVGIGVGERNRCSAETLSYVTLEAIDSVDHAELERGLEEMVLRAQAHATLLGRKTAPERVASAILDLADQFLRPSRGCKRNTICFNLHPTRGDLADWLGLTVETVSRCFTRIKKAGLIDFNHPEIVTLLQPATLAEIAAGSRAIDNTNQA